MYESKKLSNDFAANLEVLLAQYPGGYDKKVQQWIDGLPPDMTGRLAGMGLVDSGRIAGGLPIQYHIDGYIEHLKHKQNTADYCDKCKTRIQGIIDGCRFLTLSEILPGKILKFVSDEMKIGRELNGVTKRISQGTFNHYLRAIKGFLRWLYIENRLHTDLSKNLKLITVTDIKKRRRPLTLDEIAYLLNWLETKGKKAKGLTGWERGLLYRFAMSTGLRADEIRTLKISNIDVDNSTVHLQSAYTKNRKEAALPIRPDVLEDLKTLAKGKLPGVPLFRRITDKTAAMLRKDMKDARADYLIEKKIDGKNDVFLVPDTDEGEIDFHSLRHTFGTLLAASGINPKTAQTLMRHSSITLTMDKYSHSYREAETAAVNMLRSFDKSVKQEKKNG